MKCLSFYEIITNFENHTDAFIIISLYCPLLDKSLSRTVPSASSFQRVSLSCRHSIGLSNYSFMHTSQWVGLKLDPWGHSLSGSLLSSPFRTTLSFKSCNPPGLYLDLSWSTYGDHAMLNAFFRFRVTTSANSTLVPIQDLIYASQRVYRAGTSMAD